MRARPVDPHRCRLRRLLLGAAAAALGLTALGAGLADFRVESFRLLPEGAAVEYPAATDRYYRLLRGEQVTEFTHIVQLRLGLDREAATGLGTLHDAAPPTGTAFYRIEEIPLGTPLDSDGDGLDDVTELRHSADLALDPLDHDSDRDGIPDGAEDFDGDSLSNAFEVAAGTDPTKKDSDFNGVNDGDEDPDGDYLSNRDEALAGTNPGLHDTDGDGWNDEEWRLGGDALDPRVFPFGIVTATPSLEVVSPALPRTAENEFVDVVTGLPSIEVVSPALETDAEGFAVEVVAGLPTVVVRPPSQGVDLAVTASVSPVRVTEGEPVTVTVRVENHGLDPATGVRLTFKLPPGATVQSLGTSAGSCEVQNGEVVCGVALIPFIGFTVEATLGTGGILTDDADGFWWWDWDFVVAANEPDASPGDNLVHLGTLLLPRLDYGDAPEPLYPTTRWFNGARHRFSAFGPRFGLGVGLPANPDYELDGYPSDHGEGDDVGGTDDEDGITFLTPLEPGETAEVAIQVPVGPAGKVDAWIDLERDGWSAADRIMTGETVLGGLPFTKTFTVPTTAIPGQTFARFRISTTGVADFTGYAGNGEVEDYWVEIEGCNCPTGQIPAGTNPQVDSWLTLHSAEYARIRESHGATPVTTWSNRVDGVDHAYADIQKIASYGSFVYVQSHGLASHIMGPWYFDHADTIPFPNLPEDQTLVFKLPTSPAPDPPVHGNTPMGVIGLWVNGTAIYNATDGFSWSKSLLNTNETPSVVGMDDADPLRGSNVWHRSAWHAESVTFDYTLFHSPENGQHHSHVHPAALRLQLLDNVAPIFGIVGTEILGVMEQPGTKHHSPILGWSPDGFPIYGPYGFSDPQDVKSGVRRMVSGYIKRDGSHGTNRPQRHRPDHAARLGAAGVWTPVQLAARRTARSADHPPG